MEQNFEVKTGEITFKENKIIVSDNARIQIRNQFLMSGVWLLVAIINVWTYFKTGDHFSLWVGGLLIGILHLILLISLLRRTSKSEIEKSEINSIVIKEKFGNKFLNIKLKNNKLRRVDLLEQVSEEMKLMIATFN
jgi:hypothetical protein